MTQAADIPILLVCSARQVQQLAEALQQAEEQRKEPTSNASPKDRLLLPAILSHLGSPGQQ
jgi:hypothetical protein